MVTVYFDAAKSRCVIQTKKYSPGNFTSEITDGKLSLWKDDKLLLDKIPVTDIADQAGTPYADEAALEIAITDFFVKAPAGGGLKWKTYKALLTQIDTDAPVARVLNQDEPDYLGDIIWTRLESGNYEGILSATQELPLMSINMSNQFATNGDATFSRVQLYNFESETRVNIATKDTLFSATDNELRNTSIEIKVRQRGTPPVLLTAETDEAGDKIILTFDKKMNNYFFYETLPSTLKIKYNNEEDDLLSFFGYTEIIAIDNTIEFTLQGSLLNTDVLSINVIANYDQPIEAFDYGALQPFENFPVKNNVLQ